MDNAFCFHQVRGRARREARAEGARERSARGLAVEQEQHRERREVLGRHEDAQAQRGHGHRGAHAATVEERVRCAQRPEVRAARRQQQQERVRGHRVVADHEAAPGGLLGRVRLLTGLSILAVSLFET